MASLGLCRPLIPVSTMLPEAIFAAFVERVEQATKSLLAVNSGAVLVLLIDAADNSELAEGGAKESREYLYPMTTEKQILANRQNALKSTGPRSCVGKMISSRNSTRHGFYANSVLLPDDDHDEFVRLARRLVLAYAPCGVLEEEQVRIIIETRWRLRRANVVDTEVFQMYRVYEGEARGVGTAFAQDATQGNSFSKLVRYESHLMRKLDLAELVLERLKASRNLVPRPLEVDGLECTQVPALKIQSESDGADPATPAC